MKSYCLKETTNTLRDILHIPMSLWLTSWPVKWMNVLYCIYVRTYGAYFIWQPSFVTYCRYSAACVDGRMVYATKWTSRQEVKSNTCQLKYWPCIKMQHFSMYKNPHRIQHFSDPQQFTIRVYSPLSQAQRLANTPHALRLLEYRDSWLEHRSWLRVFTPRA
jgi:hypothetical protein